MRVSGEGDRREKPHSRSGRFKVHREGKWVAWCMVVNIAEGIVVKIS